MKFIWNLALSIGLSLIMAGCPAGTGTGSPGTPGTGGPGKGGPGSSGESCADLTAKGAAGCTKADAIAGKTCVYEFDACFETSDVLTKFREQDLSFKSDIQNEIGIHHTETADWKMLCEGTASSINSIGSAVDALKSLTVKFKKDKKEADVALDCKAGGVKTFSFPYEARPTSDNALLIRLNSKGDEVKGKFGSMGTPTSNLLDYFTKSNWLYSPTKDELFGLIQLFKLGFTTFYTEMELKSEDDFVKGFSYARKKTSEGGGGGDSIGKKDGQEVAAIGLQMKKI